MSYTKIGWQNSPNASTPLTAENLDKMDSGIKKNSDDIEEANNAFSTFKTGEFATATTDISNLKEDNTTNKRDISQLKIDVSGAKTSINDLKNDVTKINPKITALESVTGQLNKDVSKAKEDITNNLTTLKQADKGILDKIGDKQDGKAIKASNTIAQDLKALDTALSNLPTTGGGGFNSQSLIVKQFTGTYQPLPRGTGYNATINYTVPSGYRLLCILGTTINEALVSQRRGVTGNSVTLLVYNPYQNWDSPAGTVIIEMLFAKIN
jgi:hypothetical protein